MKTQSILSMLLLTAMFVSPASANWFANPRVGINLQLGSAPSPTPDDVLSGRQPMLVRDADGNVLAMIDTVTGKVIATAEPPAPVTARSNSVPTKTAASPARAH
jgi:hypothetical protein